ncbi:cytochrome P450 [Spirillospora sp. NBC_00431]
MTAVADHRLGRRLHIVKGLHALHGTRGDPYALLLSRPGGHLRLYEDLLSGDPVRRSATGAWVAARHATVTRLAEHPDLVPVSGLPLACGAPPPSWETGPPWLGSPGTPPPEGDPALLAESAARACHRLLDSASAGFDMADLADRLAVEVYAETLAPPDATTGGLVRLCAAAAASLDSALSPQPFRATAAMFSALDELRGMGADPMYSVAWVRLTADLISHAVLALLDHRDEWLGLCADPGRAGAVTDEVLRFDPPVHAREMIALRDLQTDGAAIAAGDRVVLLAGAANRDPDVFPSPARFIPGAPGPRDPLPIGPPYGPLLPGVRASAEVVLRVLADRLPDLNRAGSARRWNNAPVTRRLSFLPVRTGQGSTP